MATTKTPIADAQALPLTAHSPTLNGTIAIKFDPERDNIGASVGKAAGIRILHFTATTGYEDQGDGRSLPQFTVVALKAGTNWVDAATWQQIKQQESQKKHDLLGLRMRLGAIVEFTPTSKLTQLTGTLSDYAVDICKTMIDTTYDVGLLRDWQRSEARHELINYIGTRIKQIESGEQV